MKMRKISYLLLAATLTFTACKKKDDPKTVEETPVENPNELSGEKTVEGGEVSGVWKKGAKITVKGSLVIPAGKSLTIEEGVTVMFAKVSVKQEILVYGNLYCKGSAQNRIRFTVTDDQKPVLVDFPRLWGGILFNESCKELLLLYTNIEYCGAVTTEESQSVKLGFYKAAAGEGLPAINFRNAVDGKAVIMNCQFNNLGEDCLYLEGGKFIIANNVIYTQGETGGDAINLKSGSVADICFNFVYSPNTNCLKLSNSGDRSPQCNPICYNNTIVNSAWRRPTIKGGGIWLEAAVKAEVYNNLHVNARFALKNSGGSPDCKYDYNYYYGNSQENVNNYQASTPDVVRGLNDIAGTLAGEKDPLLVNYPLTTSTSNAKLDPSWDFHLKAGSPALNAGTTNFTTHYSASGLSLDGTVYTSPAASKNIGAYGTN